MLRIVCAIIGVLLGIAVAVTGCATRSVDSTIPKKEISQQRALPATLQKDSRGKTFIKFPKSAKLSRANRRMLEDAATAQLDTMPTPKPGDVAKLQIYLDEWISMSDLLVDKRIPNAHNGKRMLDKFIENRLAAEWQFGSHFYYMPPITGEIRARSRDNDEYYEFTLAQELLPSHVHKTGRLVVRILKEKVKEAELTRLWEYYIPGRKINCEGFLSREGNTIVIDAQGKFELRKGIGMSFNWAHLNSINLGITVELTMPDIPDGDGKVEVGEPIVD